MAEPFGPLPSGQDVADFLGQGDDAALVALAERQVGIVTALARSYTRGRGFDGTDAAQDLAAVIVAATARLAVNPDQDKRFQLGDYSVMPAQFVGWSLPETMVLNRYRRRAL